MGSAWGKTKKAAPKKAAPKRSEPVKEATKQTEDCQLPTDQTFKEE